MLCSNHCKATLFGCTGSLTVSSVAAGGGCLLVAVRGLLTAAAPLVEEQGLWGIKNPPAVQQTQVQSRGWKWRRKWQPIPCLLSFSLTPPLLREGSLSAVPPVRPEWDSFRTPSRATPLLCAWMAGLAPSSPHHALFPPGHAPEPPCPPENPPVCPRL